MGSAKPPAASLLLVLPSLWPSARHAASSCQTQNGCTETHEQGDWTHHQTYQTDCIKVGHCHTALSSFCLLAHLLRSSFATASLRDATSLACEITGKLLDETQGILYLCHLCTASVKKSAKVMLPEESLLCRSKQLMNTLWYNLVVVATVPTIHSLQTLFWAHMNLWCLKPAYVQKNHNDYDSKTAPNLNLYVFMFRV